MATQTLPIGDLIIAIMLGLAIFRALIFLLGLLWQLGVFLTWLINVVVTLFVKAGVAITVVFIIYMLINNALHA